MIFSARSLNPADLAGRLAAQSSLWRPLVQFDPDERFYERLITNSSHEAWLLTWLPGQGTEWHDHGGSAGAFAVVEGLLSEEVADLSLGGAPRPRREVQQHTPGGIRRFGRKHVHRVINNGDRPAISLHVYAPRLHTMNEYAVDAAELRLVTTQQVGADW